MPISRDLADALIEVVRDFLVAEERSVRWLAIEIGVAQQTLDRQLKGRGDITIDEWAAIADAMGTTIAELTAKGATRL